MKFQQIKTGVGNYTPIEEDTIEKIACIKAFSDAKLNAMLWKYHQELLRYAKNKNENKEVGFFWDLNNVEKNCLKIKGEINGFSIHDKPEVFQLVSNPYSIASVVVMHNHPRNGLFSDVDIRSFTDFNAIYIMTAVCNDGTIYMIRKERSFEPLLMQKYYNEGVIRSQKAAKDELLKKAKSLKLDADNPDDKDKIAKIPAKPYYYGIKNVARHAKEIGITYRCSVKRK